MARKIPRTEPGQRRKAAGYPVASQPTSPGPAQGSLRQPLALLLLAAIVITWPWLSGRVTIPWDAKAQFLPQIQFLAQSLAKGQSPFWAPYVFSGQPQIADPQSMIFSPPFLALALVDGAPGLRAVDATLLAMVFLAGAALMLWFRDRGWHWAGGLIAALAFCWGAAMAWRIQHFGQVLSLAYLPVALLCLDRALTRASLGWGLAAGAVLAAMALGRDQVALLAIYLLAAYAAWRVLGSADRAASLRASLLPLGAAGLLAVLAIAIPVTLTALLAGDSNRPVIDYAGAGAGSLHPALLITAVLPDGFGASGRMEDYWGPPSFAWAGTGLFIAQNMGQLYIGAVPLLILLLSAAQGRLWAAEVRFFTAALIFTLFYALGWYTPLFAAAYALLPGVSLYRRPADAVFLVGALGAILAGYGVHRLFRDPLAPVRRAHVLVAACAVLLAALCLVLLAAWLGRMPRLGAPLGLALISFTVGALALAFARMRIPLQPMLAATLLAAVTTADLAYNNGPSSSSALPPDVYDVLEPGTRNATIAILKSKVVDNENRRDRIELAGLGFHWPNASLTHGLENTLGYNPVRLALYSAAVGAEDHVGLPDQRKFSPLFPSYRSTLANLLGLRFIVTGAPIESIDRKLKAGDFPLVAHTSDGYIYENAAAAPRIAFVTQARTADFARMLRDGVWPDADLAITVLLENAPPATAARPPGTARIASYRNTEVVVEADSPAGGWVVLNDVWHPWWFAEIDGRPAPLLRANVLFRAVPLPPGRHTIRFRFRPLAGAWSQLRGR